VILAAQSDYYKVLFSGRWRLEAGSRFPERLESDVLANVLHFIYTGDLPVEVTSETVVDLLLESHVGLLDSLSLVESLIVVRLVFPPGSTGSPV